MVALAPMTKIINGVTFQPLVMILLMSGLYFVVFFLSRVIVANLSLQYVNYMDCIMSFGVGVVGGERLYAWPMT